MHSHCSCARRCERERQKILVNGRPRTIGVLLPSGVGKVIKGWDQGCLGMKVGEQRKLTIPGDEGYGGAGFPAWGIPPNATLEFTLKCLEVA